MLFLFLSEVLLKLNCATLFFNWILVIFISERERERDNRTREFPLANLLPKSQLGPKQEAGTQSWPPLCLQGLGCLHHHLLYVLCTLAGNRNWKLSWDLNPSTLVWNKGIPIGMLPTRSDTCELVLPLLAVTGVAGCEISRMNTSEGSERRGTNLKA